MSWEVYYNLPPLDKPLVIILKQVYFPALDAAGVANAAAASFERSRTPDIEYAIDSKFAPVLPVNKSRLTVSLLIKFNQNPDIYSLRQKNHLC